MLIVELGFSDSFMVVLLENEKTLLISISDSRKFSNLI